VRNLIQKRDASVIYMDPSLIALIADLNETETYASLDLKREHQ
jgi:hypothetical protein